MGCLLVLFGWGLGGLFVVQALQQADLFLGLIGTFLVVFPTALFWKGFI